MILFRNTLAAEVAISSYKRLFPNATKNIKNTTERKKNRTNVQKLQIWLGSVQYSCVMVARTHNNYREDDDC